MAGRRKELSLKKDLSHAILSAPWVTQQASR